MSDLCLNGKVLGMNTSDGCINLLIDTKTKDKMNIKVPMTMGDVFKIGNIYYFELQFKKGVERDSYILESYKAVEDMDTQEVIKVMEEFDNASPVSYEDGKKVINEYISKIDNKIIKDITVSIFNDNEKNFYTFPAGVKYHHAYTGGLAYHTIGMLKMADSFLENYDYLDKDYLYAGILLHDIGKVSEFTGVENTEYALKGQMLGHLVIGGMMISEKAKDLGYSDTNEALILEHMIISHHGQAQFGAAKRPMTPEALVLWYIDLIDSKFRVLGDELAKVNVGEYTDQIGVLDRMKIYKVK